MPVTLSINYEVEDATEIKITKAKAKGQRNREREKQSAPKKKIIFLNIWEIRQKKKMEQAASKIGRMGFWG